MSPSITTAVSAIKSCSQSPRPGGFSVSTCLRPVMILTSASGRHLPLPAATSPTPCTMHHTAASRSLHPPRGGAASKLQCKNPTRPGKSQARCTLPATVPMLLAVPMLPPACYCGFRLSACYCHTLTCRRRAPPPRRPPDPLCRVQGRGVPAAQPAWPPAVHTPLHEEV